MFYNLEAKKNDEQKLFHVICICSTPNNALKQNKRQKTSQKQKRQNKNINISQKFKKCISFFAKTYENTINTNLKVLIQSSKISKLNNIKKI